LGVGVVCLLCLWLIRQRVLAILPVEPPPGVTSAGESEVQGPRGVGDRGK